ncbi:zinc finger protein 436-like isoform X1 [Dendropsophus ebraccatus]|uniref:zinc finger protein 436-like isoform X1 n=1 Tax=Dendropsophus ebraccatus TaxID=150705 RepID=UPI00383133A1
MFLSTKLLKPLRNDYEVTEKILHLSFQIIYLLTREDYTVVKKTSEECEAPSSRSGGWSRARGPKMEPPLLTPERDNAHNVLDLIYKMMELLTGEVPIRCQDVAVYFSMEEWEYVEGHKDLYRDAMMSSRHVLPGESQSLATGPGIHGPLFTKTCARAKRAKDITSRPKRTSCAALPPCHVPPYQHIPAEHVQLCPSQHVNKDPVSFDEGNLKEAKKSRDDTPQCPYLQIKEEPVSCEERSPKDAKTSTDDTPQCPRLQIKEEPVSCEERSPKDAKTSTDDTPQCPRLQIKQEPVSCEERRFTNVDMKKKISTPNNKRPHLEHIKKGGPREVSIGSPLIRRAKVNNGQMVWNMENAVPLERNPVSNRHSESRDQKLKPFVCPKCNKDFSSKQLLALHQRSHMREKPFLCSKCGKCFSKISHYIRHQSVHIGVKPYTCPDCGKSFSDRSYLSRHQRMHTDLISKPFKCPECEVRFMNQYELVAHCKIHTGKKPFECSECGKRFTRNYQLLKHEKVHTGDVPFLCSQCGTCFRNNALLVKHQQYHSKEKQFPCPECGKSFSDRSHFVRHVRIHTGEKPFMCSECGRRFNDKSSLSRHHRLHTGEKPYACTDCGQSFRYSSTLLKHQEVHRISKPFKCPECDTYFMSNSELLTHCSVHSAGT